MSEESKAYKLHQDHEFYYVGAMDPELRVFDIVMYTPFGTSYNAYLIKGKSANVLIETVKEKFSKQMFDKIDSVLAPGEKIDYIIHNHTEPDHSGSSYKVLQDRYPEAKVIASAKGLQFLKSKDKQDFELNSLKEIGNEKVKGMKALLAGKDIKTLDIGGYTFTFHNAPFLHWPDSMFTYCKELQALFTCDVFGSHYTFPKIVDTELEENSKEFENYMQAFSYYYNMIFGPYKKYVLDGVKIFKQLKDKFGMKFICNSHGPVLVKNIDAIVKKYEEWSESGKIPAPKRWKEAVSIIYVTAYGFTKEIAEATAEGIKKENVPVEMFNVLESKEEDINKALFSNKGILFGTPTIVNDALPPIWKFATSLNPMINMGQVAGTFG